MRKKTNTALFAAIAVLIVLGSFYYTWKMIIPKYTQVSISPFRPQMSAWSFDSSSCVSAVIVKVVGINASSFLIIIFFSVLIKNPLLTAIF